MLSITGLWRGRRMILRRSVGFWTIVGGLLLLFVHNTSQARPSTGRKSTMKIEVNHLAVEISVTTPRIQRSDDLQIRVVFTNQSSNEMVLNALFLDFGTILLSVRKSDTTSVPMGPPPMPPIDDGKTGRITLQPGQSATFKYRGVNLFGRELPHGSYQLRFAYENQESANTDAREWKGLIQSDWLAFDIVRTAGPVNQSGSEL